MLKCLNYPILLIKPQSNINKLYLYLSIVSVSVIKLRNIYKCPPSSYLSQCKPILLLFIVIYQYFSIYTCFMRNIQYLLTCFYMILFVFNVLCFSESNIKKCLDWITFRKIFLICIYNYIIFFYPNIFLTFNVNSIILIIISICMTKFVIFSANLNHYKLIFAKSAFNTFIFNSTTIILQIRIIFLHYILFSTDRCYKLMICNCILILC